MKKGAVLVDIRESGERRRRHIAGSLHRPLSALQQGDVRIDADDVIYFCASGIRTRSNAARLSAVSGARAAILDGGLDAWAGAGLPVVEDRTAPIDIMRQVMIAAGTLVLVGVVLGSVVSPVYFALSAFVGAGLVFSGMTGICAMARILSLAPWNR